jgi:hypothetical protein
LGIAKKEGQKTHIHLFLFETKTKRHRYEQKQKSGEQTQISLHEPLTGFLAGAGAEV